MSAGAPVLRLETERFGPFTFHPGLDPATLELAIVRVQDSAQRFSASPLARAVVRLEREVLTESVHGTNTIEGADLTPDETDALLALPAQQLKGERELRVRNIRNAHDLAVASAADPRWQLDVPWMRAVHAAVCADLTHPDNLPGALRDNPDVRVTYVGDAAHGGRYKPPQHGRDIHRLLEGLVTWHGQLVGAGVPALIRAPLVHLYFERIHPFWDGNGRTGRVIEATLLLQAGFRHAPFALWRYYLDHVDTYFTLFNTCRKADDAKRPAPHQPFVAFHLEGLRATLERLHDRVNAIVGAVLMEAELRAALDAGRLNARQHAVARQVMDHGAPLPLARLRERAAYRALYAGLTDKTMQRDLRRLRDDGWLHLDAAGCLSAGSVAPP